jgi:hypothetical protein
MKKQVLALSLALAGIVCACLIDIACPEIGNWRAGEAQGVVATLDSGRTFNYGRGEWTLGTTPGVEVTYKDLTLGASFSFDTYGTFERACSASWMRERGRLSFGVSGGVSFYPALGRDLYASGSLRFTIR